MTHQPQGLWVKPTVGHHSLNRFERAHREILALYSTPRGAFGPTNSLFDRSRLLQCPKRATRPLWRTFIAWRMGPVVISSVETITVDEFVQQNSIATVDFIKVDIEGSEMRFIKGARETLRAHRPGLMLELKDQLLKADGSSLEEVWALLSSLDYVPFDIEKGRFTPIDAAKDGRHIVWHPREKPLPPA